MKHIQMWDVMPDLPSNYDIVVAPQNDGADTTATTGGQRRNDLFPEMCVAWLAINLIDKAPRRARRALEKQIDGVVQAIQTFGFRVPILVRSKPGGERYEVVDGHIRLEAARRLGAPKIACILVDGLSETELRRLRLSMNKLQETGEWDVAQLKLEIDELITIDDDLVIPGFEPAEIEGLRFGVGDQTEPDPADTFEDLIDEGAEPISRPGDIWALGEHYILCGSARNGDAIVALLDGQVVDAIFADPPFNVAVGGHVSTVKGRHPEFAEASGEMSPEAFVAFLETTLGNAARSLKPGGVIFACIDWRTSPSCKKRWRLWA